MSDSLPDPLVPLDVDLRDFAFMPLDVVRLRDSGLTAKASGDEFRAAVLLWCASWHQVPAASLPDDDDELANICGYSRARREWNKIAGGARRGWLKCSDGRLYHDRVAAKALEAWIEKLASAIGGAVGNAKRWNVEIDTDTQRAQFSSAVTALRALDPQSRTLRKKVVAVLTMPSRAESPPDSQGDSPPDSPPDRKGQGQGQGQGQGLVKDTVPDGTDAAAAASPAPADPPPPPAPPVPPPPKSADELTRTELWRAGKSLLREQEMPEAQCGTFVGKLVKDYGEAIVVEAVRAAVVQRPADAATWLVGACKAAKGRAGGTGKPGQLTGDQQVAASLAKAQRVAAAMAPKNGEPRPAANPTELIDG